MAPYPALRTTPHARTPARPTTELEVGVPTKTKRALRTVRFATTHDCAKNLAILISLRSKALPTLKRSKKNPKTKKYSEKMRNLGCWKPAGRYLLPTTQYLPATTYYLLPTTYYLLPTTYYLVPTTYHLPPTTYHLPPATYYLPPTTYYPRPTIYYLLDNNLVEGWGLGLGASVFWGGFSVAVSYPFSISCVRDARAGFTLGPFLRIDFPTSYEFLTRVF